MSNYSIIMFFFSASLICAAVLFVMWKNIAEEHEHYKVHKRRRKISRNLGVTSPRNLTTTTSENETDAESDFRSAHQYSVDCTHANTGLFSGIFVMVLVIISLIVFFVLITSSEVHLHQAAITVASLTELSLYCITSIAVLVGMCQVRIFKREHRASSFLNCCCHCCHCCRKRLENLSIC